jgi:hypothetical protein
VTSSWLLPRCLKLTIKAIFLSQSYFSSTHHSDTTQAQPIPQQATNQVNNTHSNLPTNQPSNQQNHRHHV